MSDIVKYEEYAVARMDITDLAETIADNLGDVGITEGMLPRVKIPGAGGTTWTIPGLMEEVESKALSGIVAWWKPSQLYFPNAFSGGGEPPACRSKDARFGEGVFGRGSEANPTGACSICPMNKFGSSDPSDPDSKPACTLRYNIFLLRPDALMPVVLSLPPSSIKGWKDFMSSLVMFTGAPYHSLQVEATLEKDTSKTGIEFSRVKWRVAGQLPPAQAADMRKYHQTIKELFSDFIDIEIDDDPIVVG